MHSLSLLGGASLGGEESPPAGRIVQRRRLALLAFLASSRDRTLSRDKLIACLWPESGATQARHSLSDSLHVIRKALGEDAVLVEGDEVRLNPEVVSCDLWQFETALAEGDLERAVRFYAGPFLDGFFIGGDALEFESWAASERERLARAYAGTLERLAERAAAEGNPQRAAEWWHRLCAEDPDNSRAVLGLMTALVAVGDRAAALRQADEHAEHLKSEYGAEPDPTVTALARRLQEEPEVWVPVAAASDSGSAARGAKLSQGSLDPVTGDPEEADGALPGGFQRTFAPRQTFLGGAAAAILVLLTAFYVARREPESEHLTPEEVLAANAAPGIAVLPFTVRGEELEVWREGMVDVLSTNLDGAAGVRAIDGRTVLARWREAVPDTASPDLETVLAVARRTGARYALTGDAVASGAGVRFATEIYDLDDGRMLGHAQVDGSPDSLFQLVDQLSIEILRVIYGGGGDPLSIRSLASATTGSLPALKSYLEGEVLYRKGEFNRALGAYERAVATDSTFALAIMRIADVKSIKGRAYPDEMAIVKETYERALRFAHRLSSRDAMLVRASYDMDGQSVASVDSLRRGVQRYPDDPDFWYQLGIAYIYAHDHILISVDEVDRIFSRALALDPSFVHYYIWPMAAAFVYADSARAAKLIEAMSLRFAALEDPFLAAYPLAFSLGFGDSQTQSKALEALGNVQIETAMEAIRLLGHPRSYRVKEMGIRRYLARPDADSWWAIGLVQQLYMQGRIRAALEQLDDPRIAPNWRASEAYNLVSVGTPLPAAQIEPFLAGSSAEASPIGEDPPPETDHLSDANVEKWRTDFFAGAYAADQGRWAVHETAIDRLRTDAASADSLEVRDYLVAAKALEAYGWWKQGRGAKALPALEAAHREAAAPNRMIKKWLGELMLELGRSRDAARIFESIWLDPYVSYELGKIYADLGEFEKARESYEYALLAWRDADPELQPHIKAARWALSRLPKPLRQ